MNASQTIPPAGCKLILQNEVVPQTGKVLFHSEAVNAWIELRETGIVRGRPWNPTYWRPMAVPVNSDYSEYDEGGVV